MFALGKKPAQPEAFKFKFKDYVTSTIWVPSGDFGHTSLINDWRLFGNDKVGDCAIAQPYHSIMLWNKMAGVDVNIDTQCVLDAYSVITGYDQKDSTSDHGSDMFAVARYWRNNGLKDSDGNIHKVDSFVALEAGNFQELITAMYLFNGVGIGVSLPDGWMHDFQFGHKPWDAIENPKILGGHAIMGCGRVDGMIQVITWGGVQPLTQAGYEQFNDESVVYLSKDMFADINGKNIDGFDYQQLQADINDLSSVSEEVEIAKSTLADDGGNL